MSERDARISNLDTNSIFIAAGGTQPGGQLTAFPKVLIDLCFVFTILLCAEDLARFIMRSWFLFIESHFDGSIYHRGMRAQKWKSPVSAEHEALQRVSALFAIFHTVVTAMSSPRIWDTLQDFMVFWLGDSGYM